MSERRFKVNIVHTVRHAEIGLGVVELHVPLDLLDAIAQAGSTEAVLELGSAEPEALPGEVHQVRGWGAQAAGVDGLWYGTADGALTGLYHTREDAEAALRRLAARVRP